MNARGSVNAAQEARAVKYGAVMSGSRYVRDRVLTLPERGPAGALAPPPVRYVAEEDAWLLRPDLGPGVRVLVRAGELLPLGAEQYAQQPVQPGELDG